MMLGFKPGRYFQACWMFLSPVMMMVTGVALWVLFKLLHVIRVSAFWARSLSKTPLSFTLHLGIFVLAVDLHSALSDQVHVTPCNPRRESPGAGGPSRVWVGT